MPEPCAASLQAAASAQLIPRRPTAIAAVCCMHNVTALNLLAVCTVAAGICRTTPNFCSAFASCPADSPPASGTLTASAVGLTPVEAQIELEDSEPGELTNYLCHERCIMLLLVHACACSSDVTRDKYSICSATSIGHLVTRHATSEASLDRTLQC